MGWNAHWIRWLRDVDGVVHLIQAILEIAERRLAHNSKQSAHLRILEKRSRAIGAFDRNRRPRK
jgi:hypothetical protein